MQRVPGSGEFGVDQQNIIMSVSLNATTEDATATQEDT
jgi:hypothetical protein